MYIASHTTLIYYNNYYYDNSNCYLFLLSLCCCSCCMCVRVCVVLCCLSCMCMRALLCVLAYTHTCVSMCVYPPPHPPGLCCGEEANVLIWGGYISGKNFSKFWKWGISRTFPAQELFSFGITILSLFPSL